MSVDQPKIIEFCQPIIRYFDAVFSHHQDVVALEIFVKDTFAVQKQQSFQYLSHNITGPLFTALALLLDVLVKGPSFGNLHHNRELLPSQFGILVFHHFRML